MYGNVVESNCRFLFSRVPQACHSKLQNKKKIGKTIIGMENMNESVVK
jgi:hypothetical protein